MAELIPKVAIAKKQRNTLGGAELTAVLRHIVAYVLMIQEPVRRLLAKTNMKTQAFKSITYDRTPMRFKFCI